MGFAVRSGWAVLLVSMSALAWAGEFDNPVLANDFPDPTFWQDGKGVTYGVATGLRTIMRTQDLVHWEDTGVNPVVSSDRAELEKFSRHFWAPDAVRLGYEYRIYVTQFVSSRTNRLVCLSSENPTGPFRFRSVVIESWKKNIWDVAIDSEVRTVDGKVWLFTGSVAGGVWRTRLSDDGLSLDPDAPFEHAAGLVPPSPAGKWRGWIYSHRCYEGSYLYRRNGWWYLFVSSGSIFEDGVHPGYGLYVGRSRTLEGDFVDKTGLSMLAGGGTRLLSSAGEFAGAGHNGDVFTDAAGRTYMFFHSHWKGSKSRSLDLQQLHWDSEGWPYFDGGCVKKRGMSPQLPVRMD